MALIENLRPRPFLNTGRPAPCRSKRCELQLSGRDFLERLAATPITKENRNARVAVNPENGGYSLLQGQEKSEQPVMPLRFEALCKAFNRIEDSQPWLMGSCPIVKTQDQGMARIDFLNYGGFVFRQDGSCVSQSINAW